MFTTNWVSKLCSELQFKNYTDNTIKSYCYYLEQFLNEFQDTDHPRRITECEIKDYLKQASSVSVLKQQIGSLKFFYKHVIRQPLKFRHIEYPRKERKLPTPLSLPDIQKVFDVCTNIKHKSLLVTMYSTGVRISELLNIKVKGDIDAERGVLYVRGGKGRKDRQTPLDASVVKLLRRYYKAYRPSVYLFEGPRGKYSATSVRNILHRACDRAGVRRIHPHLLRHCFGTHMIEEGKDISILQRMLGHNSIKSTQIYTHISPAIISKTGSPVKALTI